MRICLVAVYAIAFGLAAPVARADNSRLVLGVSIGDVRMGATNAQVAAAYGKPRVVMKLSYGGKPFDLATYAAHSKPLAVYYDRSTHRVVGIATSSPFYRTADGFGVGASAADARARGFTWNAQCTVTYLKSARGMWQEISTRRHSPSGAITNISFIRSAYAGDC